MEYKFKLQLDLFTNERDSKTLSFILIELLFICLKLDSKK